MPRFLRSLLALVLFASPLLAEAPKTGSQLQFLRTQELPGNIGSLQTLSAEFTPPTGQGPRIWLIGVAHLGTREYYTALQKRLDAQNVVLFEGIGAEKLTEGKKPDTTVGIQGKLANALGLVFQLEAIDYQRPHFVNTDFNADTLNAAIERKAEQSSKAAAAAESAAVEARPGEAKKPDTVPAKVDNQTFQKLMQALQGEGEMAESIGGMITLMGSTPEMRETTKLMLIEALGQAGELIDLAKSASTEMRDLFDVLLTERNEEVMRKLKAQLQRLGPGQTVAIFYGAAHMDEIANRLKTELNYNLGGQQWDTVFTADSTKSIMPPAQMKFLMQMMRAQLQNPEASGTKSGDVPFLKLFNPDAK